MYSAGVGPQEYHLLSLRRAMQFFRTERDRRRERWRHTATLGCFVINNAGMGAPDSPVRPQDIAPDAFPNRSQVMSKERYEENFERHQERLERQSDGE